MVSQLVPQLVPPAGALPLCCVLANVPNVAHLLHDDQNLKVMLKRNRLKKYVASALLCWCISIVVGA